MLSARRPVQPRHEFRFGTRELIILGAAFLLIWGLTFVFGMLVGRELSGSTGARAGGAGAKSAAAAATTPEAERQPPGTPARKAERGGFEEKLTFYKTLTAPTLDLPATGPAPSPKIEERIVPHEAPPKAVPEQAPRPSAPAVPPPVAASSAARTPKAVAEPAHAPAAERRVAAIPAAPGADAARLWTVQVSSFRSRALAEELRSELAAKGFDVYLVSVTTEEGRVRHRVRVGGFSTRAEAERVAGELRGERNLNPFVTTRPR